MKNEGEKPGRKFWGFRLRLPPLLLSTLYWCPALRRVVASHSRPSYRPSPEVAQVDWMYYKRISIGNGYDTHTGELTYPGALSQAVETKLIGDLGSVHCVLLS